MTALVDTSGIPLRFQSGNQFPFRVALREAAQKYLAQENEDRFANFSIAIKAFVLASAMLYCYLHALHASQVWIFAISYIASIWLAMLLAMNTLHDAAHGAVFKQVALNRWLTRFISWPMGIDADIWTRRHVYLHHAYANVDGYDLDIEPNPFLRQTPFQKWLPQFTYQHRYWPIVAALSLPYLCWYGDWLDMLGKSKLNRFSAAPRTPILFLLSKCIHLTLLIGIPLWFLRGSQIAWGDVLLCYIMAQMLASCFLVAMILGTHWAEVEFFQTQPSPNLPNHSKVYTMQHTWYEHQFRTCCDWQPSPRILRHLFGGLDLHLTHHLFPTYSHRHYPALANIIQNLAKEYGLNYRCLSYSQLWQAQQRFLKEMGRRPEIEK